MDQEKNLKSMFVPIALTSQMIEKIDRWREQFYVKNRFRISRGKVLNWWIETAPEKLADEQVNLAFEKLYSRAKHLRQLIREVENAKARGEKIEFEISE
jgi:hypothetical protein